MRYAILVLALSGCSWGRPGCAVIDTAHDACVVLRYSDRTG